MYCRTSYHQGFERDIMQCFIWVTSISSTPAQPPCPQTTGLDLTLPPPYALSPNNDSPLAVMFADTGRRSESGCWWNFPCYCGWMLLILNILESSYCIQSPQRAAAKEREGAVRWRCRCVLTEGGGVQMVVWYESGHAVAVQQVLLYPQGWANILLLAVETVFGLAVCPLFTTPSPFHPKEKDIELISPCF